MLIHYNLLDVQSGYVEPGEQSWKDLEMDRRINSAVQSVQKWGMDGEWREGEEWMEDALVALLRGDGIIEALP